MAKIFVVEDDLDVAEQIQLWLSHEQHVVEVVHNGDEALDRLKFYEYDLVVMDLGLPDRSGMEILRDYRSRGGNTPILILTGKHSIVDKTEGLDTGADDYLTKPFNMKELSARIRALLRRGGATKPVVLKSRDLTLDPVSRKVLRGEDEIKLLPKEFAILEFMLRHPNEVFSPEALLNRVWNSESDSSVDTVYTTMRTLRKKISADDANFLIETIHGAGYKLNA
ncbi:MAG: response regulator transcription factor [Candidatus Obscuribacterales bacterium]|nr:response regulator transcription factor [Candidatus Obscuribacterales bacterium]